MVTACNETPQTLEDKDIKDVNISLLHQQQTEQL